MSDKLAEGLVPLELREIQISAFGQEPQVVLLGEVNGPRTFPIFIGRHEALALDDAVRGIAAPRPMTHDFIVNTLQALRAPVVRCAVVELRGDTFVGAMDVRPPDGVVVRVDCRPSDALVVAAKLGAPLFAHESVLQAMSVGRHAERDDAGGGPDAAAAAAFLAEDDDDEDDTPDTGEMDTEDLLNMLNEITGESGGAVPEDDLFANEITDHDLQDLTKEDGAPPDDDGDDDGGDNADGDKTKGDDEPPPDFDHDPERHHR